jgi:hypothetical protein
MTTIDIFHTRNRSCWIAAGANLIIFSLFILFTHPIYDSQEDMYALYRLSGGYGDPPTELLDFNLGLHPFLNWTIKSLFQFYDQINWYSFALFFAHYIFCTIVLSNIIQKKSSLGNYLMYLALLVIFEGHFLLFPDFTGSSMILTAAGIVLLLTKAWYNELNTRHYVAAIVLFVLASFFRVEPMIILPGIAIPFFTLTVSRKWRWKLLTTLAIAGASIFAFNAVHKWYYKSAQPGWSQQESYRQKLFRFFNDAAILERPSPGEKWFAEYSVITKGVIIDTATLGEAVLDSVYDHFVQKRKVSRSLSRDWANSSEWRKWFLINNRLFFLITLLAILLFGLYRKILIPALFSIGLLLAGLAYLFISHKIEPYILITSLSLISFLILLFPAGKTIENRSFAKFIVAGVLLCFIAWGIIRAAKTSRTNEQETRKFRLQYAELSSNRRFLFIHLTGFATRKFYSWDLPATYRLDNLLVDERFSGHNFYTTLHRYQINKASEILSSSNVLFWGNPQEGLKEYFEKIAGRPLQFLGPLPEFKQGQVWKIEPVKGLSY